MASKSRISNIKKELIKKSRESALAAIQTFNNPLITFKSESFIVLMVISWTYLLHAYFKGIDIEYRYFKQKVKRRKFERTKNGAYKYWELEQCLNEPKCPLDNPIKDNLRFLIEIRHEIEHCMTRQIDEYISPKFQACCINYNKTIKDLFGDKYGLDHTIPIALQLFSFSDEQVNQIKDKPNLPKNLLDFVSDFEKDLETKDSLSYSYKVFYEQVNANHAGQADKVNRFLREGSVNGNKIDSILVKYRHYTKLTQKAIVNNMQENGFPKFTKYEHQKFWQFKWKNAATRRKEAKEFGEIVTGNMWLWYEETWLPLVKDYCQKNTDIFA